MKSKLTYFAIGFVIALVIVQLKCKPDNTKDAQLYRLYEATKDSLRHYQTRDGKNVAEIASLTATNANLLQDLDTKDVLVNHLKKVVKNAKNPVSVIVHEVKTELNGSGDVQVKIVDGEIEYPIIATKVDDWFAGAVEVFEDRSDWSLSVINKFDYEVTKKKRGFLGYKGVTYNVKTVAHNPHARTEGLRSFVLDHDVDRWHVGVQAGFDVTGRVSFGVGLTYSVFSF